MKKILNLMMVMLVAIMLTGCGSESKENNNSTSGTSENTSADDNTQQDNDINSNNPYINKKFIGARTGKTLVINEVSDGKDIKVFTIDDEKIEANTNTGDFTSADGDEAQIAGDSWDENNLLTEINIKFHGIYGDTYIIEE